MEKAVLLSHDTGVLADEEVLYDNMKQVVIKRLLKQEDSTLNRQFEDFAGFYGFILKSDQKLYFFASSENMEPVGRIGFCHFNCLSKIKEPLNKSTNTSDELKSKRNVRSSRQSQAQSAGIFTE